MNKKIMYGILIGIGIFAIIFLLSWAPWIKRPQTIKPVLVGDISAIAPVLSSDNQNLFYYDANKANLFDYNFATGIKIQLSTNLNPAPNNLYWSSDKKNVIIQILYDQDIFPGTIFADPSSLTNDTLLWNYNLITQKLTKLPYDIFNYVSLDMANPVWLNDSRILYFNKGQSKTLTLANPDETNLQTLGKVPDDIYSILSYDNANNLLYYATFSTESGVYEIVKYNMKTAQTVTLLKNSQTATSLDDQHIIASSITGSFIYNLSTGQKQSLPLLVPNQKFAISPDKTKMAVASLNKKNEMFYIIDLTKRKTLKIWDPQEVNSNYQDLNMTNDGTLFYTNNKNFYRINFDQTRLDLAKLKNAFKSFPVETDHYRLLYDLTKNVITIVPKIPFDMSQAPEDFFTQNWADYTNWGKEALTYLNQNGIDKNFRDNYGIGIIWWGQEWWPTGATAPSLSN